MDINKFKNKRFTKNDAGFTCKNCEKEVKPLKYTSRNHCPHCLFSLHVDIMPGDRENSCGGMLEPISSEPSADLKKGYVITFKCRRCGTKVRNRAANDDDVNLLIELTNPERHKI
ncbi:MAG: RNHCP domain-containing protein [Oscillospiraceae bacterium]|nr:RNHCP domain-containing protein [Oscillospiraceae bacterium]